jgi:hypothetical protein
MRTGLTRLATRTALAAALCAPLPLLASSFVYEGRLEDGGIAANGRYDLRLTAFGDAKAAGALAAPMTFADVAVVDGRFLIHFELPDAPLDTAWIETAVREAGTQAFSVIAERSKAVAIPKVGQCWATTGDTGVNPAINFLGTIDSQPLVLRTANAQSLRIEPSGVQFSGLPNTANVLAGSRANGVAAGVRGATISGGGLPSGNSDPDYISEAPNFVGDHFGTVGGGFANVAGSDNGNPLDSSLATVSGGWTNRASGILSAVGGGEGNTAATGYSTVAGGQFNTSAAQWAAVLGGGSNRAAGNASSILGGLFNSASGQFSALSGGFSGCAGGDYSWAGGRRAKVRPVAVDPDSNTGCFNIPVSGDIDGDNGTFVWADSQNVDFVSSGPDQFLVRAQGGAGINVNPAQMNAGGVPRAGLLVGAINGNAVIFNPATGAALSTEQGGSIELGSGSNVANALGATPYIDFHFGTGAPQDFNVRLSNSENGILRVDGSLDVSVAARKPGGGAWGVLSDARLKHNVRDIASPLDRLLQLRGHEYEYLPGAAADASPGVQRGFIAQEVETLFPDWISEGADGYKSVAVKGFEALAVEAIRELKQDADRQLVENGARLAELEFANEQLRGEIGELRAELRRLRGGR